MTGLDAAASSAGVWYSQPPARASAVRLRRARQNFGAYRHDLTVAMRLINRVEREVLTAEWENWLADENVRCRQIGQILASSTQDTASIQDEHDGVLQAAEQEGIDSLDGLKSWHAEYCTSCRHEEELLQDSGQTLSFG